MHSQPSDTEKSTPAELQYGRVERIIRDRILRGDLRPGQRLVRRTLAKEIGVSPIPVIEALYRLEQEGLVENESNVGARVRALTLQQLQDDLVLREAIECQVARLLVGRLGPTLLDTLRQQADQLDATMQQGHPNDESGTTAHARFHFELARLTDCPILLKEERRIWSRRFMQYAWVSATLVQPVPPDWHRQLIEAIASGNIQTADEAARIHVRHNPTESAQTLAAARITLEKLEKNNWQPI